ncbi:Secreted RxLR effector peptide protein [Phytophthora cinnamomi]|uniref:Secreted RxLR effector peptide protein n=1 Tax=Phytophthora cinnamomi TaxID=4785 RepID=UPI00355A072A|nr:Secreted RxLR effector peptide protein [Phytophthora cinnamomi]
MASPGLGVLDVSLNAGDEKRSLRGLEVVNEEGEERLAGANMFSIEKLTRAMDDAKYAKRLMRRWKRHGIEIERAKRILNNTKLSRNSKLNVVYHKYAEWLDKHFSRVGPASGGNNLFHPAKLKKALKDDKYAKSLFTKWATHQYKSDGMLAKLKAVGLKEPEYKMLYKNYISWLNVHHPSDATKELARGDDLFKESMLIKARNNDEYAESLFRAWKTKGLNVPENLESTVGNVGNTLLKKYDAWLATHFPTVKTTRS